MNTPDKCPHCRAIRVEGREYACGFIFREGVKNNPRTHECLLNSEVSAHAATKRELDKLDASRWCPDRCPITFRPFFMWLDHPEKGLVPTYGGPYDSYTIPEPEMPEDGKKTEFHDIEFHCERYDHDEGMWVDGSEDPGYRVILQDRLVDIEELDAMKARVRELEGLAIGDHQTAADGLWVEVFIPKERAGGANCEGEESPTLGHAMPDKKVGQS